MEHYDYKNISEAVKGAYIPSTVVEEILRQCNEAFEHFLETKGENVSQKSINDEWFDILHNKIESLFYEHLEH
jgi:hypothetical protein